MKKILVVAVLIVVVSLFFIAIDILIVRSNMPQLAQKYLKHGEQHISSDSIGSRRIAILLRVEDPTFNTNNGLDFTTPGAGFTTISQGVGKFMLFDAFEPGIRKLRLYYLTRFALTPLIPKKQILDIFINHAYLGNSNGKEIRGFGAASRIYFKKPYRNLTDEEYLSLVAMLANPNEYSIALKPAANKDRCSRIKKLLNGTCKPTGWADVELHGCRDTQ